MRTGLLIRIALSGSVLLASSTAFAQTVSMGSGQERVTIRVGDAAVLPADFPHDVFLPPAARLQRVQQDADGARLLEFAVSGAPDVTADEYAKAMAAAGWTPARVAPVANARVFAWEKDHRALVLMLLPAADGASMHLQLRSRRTATGAD